MYCKWFREARHYRETRANQTTAQPSRNQNKDLYGAQPPSAAGINLSGVEKNLTDNNTVGVDQRSSAGRSRSG